MIEWIWLVSKQQINLKIDELLRRYNTRDPFLIAAEKGHSCYH